MSARSQDAESLAEFVLRTRSLNALRQAGIAAVGQLAELSERELLDVCGLGTKSLADLSRALADRSLALRADDPLTRLVPPRPLSGRDREVLARRASGATLAEIASRLEISRERVRQILARELAVVRGQGGPGS